MIIPWKHPWTSVVAGPTSCGKSVFVRKFVKFIDQMSDTPFARIIIYYAEWQPAYTEYGKHIEFVEGLPQSSDFAGDTQPKLIVCDDLMRESSNSSIIDLFTRGSHHRNLSVIFITQNLFHQGSGQRDISLNANYIVIFKNPRDKAQIQHLARQAYPENPRFLQESFIDASTPAHGYLLLDLKQSTPEEFRVRANIFPDDTLNYVYVPRAIKRSVPRSNVSVAPL